MERPYTESTSPRLYLPKRRSHFAIAFLYLCFITSILLFSDLYASEQPGVDVVMILDTSNSMKANDPNKIRFQAAKMFISLLDRKDRIAIVRFSSHAYSVTKLLSLNSFKNEQKLFRSLDKLKPHGQYSNLHDGLLRAHELFSSGKKSKRAKHVILMSDGEMDLGNKEKNMRLLEKTLDNLTPKLAKEKIKVHTIAFTKKSYIPLLKLAANDTGGNFIMLEDARGIHQVFETLFEKVKNPELLPLKEDSFVVDKGIAEITIVASKYKSSSTITLESPDGKEISIDKSGKNIKWFNADKFDLITIKKPAKGYWLVKYSEGGNKVYIASNFKLNAITTKKTAAPGSPMHVQAYLTQNKKKVTSKAILNTTNFIIKVTSPTGAVIENELIDDGTEIGSERHDGIFGISYSFEKEGPYKLEVKANGQTFDRVRTLFIEVKSFNAVDPFKTIHVLEKEKAEIEARAKKLSEEIAMAEAETAALAAAAEAAKNANNDATTDDHDTTAESENTEKPESENEEGELTKEEIERLRLENEGMFKSHEALIAFVLFNLFILSLGGGYYAYYKYKKKQKGKDTESEKVTALPDAMSDNVDNSPPTGTDLSEDDIDDDVKNSEFGEFEEALDSISFDEDDEESMSTTISDVELEEELSSLLETEDEK